MENYYYTTKQKKRKKHKGLNITIFILSIIAVVLLVLLIKSVFFDNKNNNADKVNKFKGIYYIDDYTAYEFNGNGKGALCLGNTTKYKFKYSVKDNLLSFDFEDDFASDATYTYTLSKNELIIVNKNSKDISYTMKKKTDS